MYEEYIVLHNKDLFSKATIQLEEALLNNLAEERNGGKMQEGIEHWENWIVRKNLHLGKQL